MQVLFIVVETTECQGQNFNCPSLNAQGDGVTVFQFFSVSVTTLAAVLVSLFAKRFIQRTL